MFKFALGVLVAVGIGAFATKPSQTDLEDEIRARLLEEIAAQSLESDDPAILALTFACKAGAQTCAELIRAGITVDYDDRILYSVARLEFLDTHASCVGVFSQFVCPGGIRKDN